MLPNLTFTLGTGTGAMGRHTKRGGYKVDWNRVRTYVVPDLEGFTVSERRVKRSNKGYVTLTTFIDSLAPMFPERPLHQRILNKPSMYS